MNTPEQLCQSLMQNGLRDEPAEGCEWQQMPINIANRIKLSAQQVLEVRCQLDDASKAVAMLLMVKHGAQLIPMALNLLTQTEAILALPDKKLTKIYRVVDLAGKLIEINRATLFDQIYSPRAEFLSRRKTQWNIATSVEDGVIVDQRIGNVGKETRVLAFFSSNIDEVNPQWEPIKPGDDSGLIQTYSLQ